MSIALIAYQTHTKTVQESPDPSLCVLVMQYIQCCGKGRSLGSRLVKIDLKDTYFAVPISEKDRKHLRFRWGNRTFQFNCLPFGPSCTP